jgi:hypothetical protein
MKDFRGLLMVLALLGALLPLTASAGGPPGVRCNNNIQAVK